MSTLGGQPVNIHEVCQALIESFHEADFADLFPKGLRSPVASWVRLNAPADFNTLVRGLQTKPDKGTHARKGWQSGMAVVLHVAKTKGMQLTERQAVLLSAHSEEVEPLLLLISDVKIKRAKVNSVKNQRDIWVFHEMLDGPTLKWLASPWPLVKQATPAGSKSSSGF